MLILRLYIGGVPAVSSSMENLPVSSYPTHVTSPFQAQIIYATLMPNAGCGQPRPKLLIMLELRVLRNACNMCENVQMSHITHMPAVEYPNRRTTILAEMGENTLMSAGNSHKPVVFKEIGVSDK